ncbi:MAG: N-acetylmuramoyl-L-alanine amidase [Mycoplasmatales bacterium]
MRVKKKVIIAVSIVLVIFSIFIITIINIVTSPLFNVDMLNIDSYNIYGESLNISVDNSFVNSFIFKSINKNNSLEQTITTTEKIDSGIEPVDIQIGEYYIFTKDNQLLYSEDIINETYYTITRDNKNYKIEFFTNKKGYLVYKKSLSKLPEDEYDIIIDPGHGGDDVGAIGVDEITYEKDINLEISQYLMEELSNLGYKVAITRDIDENPGCEGVQNYCENGRVDQVYEKNAKIVLSIHNNAGGGSGFEIYDSSFSSHTLARKLVETLAEYFTISDKETDLTELGIYNPLYEGVDYYFMIRETGGLATQGISEDNENNNSTQGAEGFILELEYLDTYVDLEVLLDENNQKLLAQLISEAVNSYINGE